MTAPVKSPERPAFLNRLAASLQKLWPRERDQRSVAEGYRVLRQYPHVVADFMARNHCFGVAPADADALTLARIEGRREAAHELRALVNLDLETLLNLRR